jgi:hypothetical protein
MWVTKEQLRAPLFTPEAGKPWGVRPQIQLGNQGSKCHTRREDINPEQNPEKCHTHNEKIQ